jgi:hypothetical protein
MRFAGVTSAGLKNQYDYATQYYPSCYQKYSKE